MKRPEFLFVNKDANSQSLSRSHAGEKTLINAHVQRGIKHSRRSHDKSFGLTTAQKYRFQFRQITPHSKILPPDEVVSSDSTENEGEANSVMQLGGGTCLGKGKLGTNVDLGFERNRDRRLLFQYLEQRLLSKRVCGQGDAIDPFSTCCVKLDQQAHLLLSYYTSVNHPNTWHTESRAKGKYTFRMDVVTVIRGCLASKWNLYAILASMASVMTCLEGRPLRRDPSYYIHKAYKETRDYIQTEPKIDGRMVMNIYHLGCAEWFRYNHEAALVHLKTVKTLADQLGGIQTLDPSLTEPILLGDGYVAAETLEVPVFSSDFDPGIDPEISSWLSHVVGLELIRARLGTGFSSILGSGDLPEALRYVIQDLVDCVVVLKTYGMHQNAPSWTLHWVHMRSIAIRHRLLEMKSVTALDRVMQAALLMWILMTMSVSGRKRSIGIIAPKLKTLLNRMRGWEWQDNTALQMWVLGIGAMSAASGTTEEQWFVDELAWAYRQQRALYGDAASAERALVDLSERFFYLEGPQKSMMQRLANLVAERQIPRS